MSRLIRLITRLCALALLLMLSAAPKTPVHAASLPSGFTETLVASGLNRPTAMQFAPDGRLFVLEQSGTIRIIQNDVLLPSPFLTLTVNSSGERGLLGIAFHPDFQTNNYIYLYYTTNTAPIHNRISRFTANGNTVVAGSEVVIMDLENLTSATNHNGGAMHFGPDGKLYIAVGENATTSNSQTLANRLGKVLRINPDGTIPTDNPFYGTATGDNRSIWTLGLRNPYTFAFHAVTGRILINDVGAGSWEEINEGGSGRNYGWPQTEGTFNPASFPNFTNPIYAYAHSGAAPTGCAVTGGTFYDPVITQFPASYANDYFFADYCSNWVRVLDYATNTTTSFATSTDTNIVDLKVSRDGNLYWLARGGFSTDGRVRRIGFGTIAPTITQHPLSQSISLGEPVTFTCSASGSTPMNYQWQRNNSNIDGATGPSYTIGAVSTGDNGATFRCVATNAYGNATSNNGTLTVISNTPPDATITAPIANSLYNGIQVITYSGTGTDSEDGSLPASAFTWEVVFHHDAHTHPFIEPTSGATGGTFTIPNTGETATNVWYRIYLTVTDSDGSSDTTFIDILPRVVNITLSSNVSGAQGTLDGQPVTLPTTFPSVTGVIRTIGVPSPQTVSGTSYVFNNWSDGGAQTHDITPPATNTTYTVNFSTAATNTPAPTNTATRTNTPTSTNTTTRTNTPTATNTPTPTVQTPAGVIVSRTGFTLTEGGLSIIYNARLTTAPAPGETVTIIPVYNAAQLIFSPASRQLNSTNWNTGRNFSVTAVDDAVLETSPMLLNITHNTNSTLGGSLYAGLSGQANINVSIIDNDSTPPTSTSTVTVTATATSPATATPTFTPSPTVTPTQTPTATQSAAAFVIVNRVSFSVTEGGTSVTYNVRLSQSPAPGETVTIVPAYDTTQLIFAPVSRQLNSSTWNTGRNFTVTALNDTVGESQSLLTQITHGTSSTLIGSPFAGISGSGVINVTVIDNDPAGNNDSTGHMPPPIDPVIPAEPTDISTEATAEPAN